MNREPMNGQPMRDGLPDRETEQQARLDRHARALHTEAAGQLSPQVRARLRPRPTTSRSNAWRPAPLGWSLATACAAVFVFAVGMRTMVPPESGPLPSDRLVAAHQAQPGPDLFDDPLLAFDEDPDLFLWLAAEARPLAME